MSDEPHSPRNPERLPGRGSIRVASAAAQDQPAPRARLLVDLPTRVIYAIAPPTCAIAPRAWRLKKEFIPGPLAAECLAHLGWSYAVSQTGHAFAEPGGHGRTVTGGDNTDDNRVQEDTPGISRTPEDHTSSRF